MADSASESDTDGAGGSSGSSAAMQSSCSSTSGAGGSGGGGGGGGGGKSGGIVISPFRLEELTNRLASLQQENKVLKIELETYKLKCKALQEENRDLRKASVTIQARAEQEEEFISNTLFKKIQALQKEKETLAVNYEKEEEFLTNELSRKLMQLQHEKAELEQHLEQEQEFQVNKLMKKIKKLENDTISKQLTLEQLRREKIDLENTLEQEQEALVNRLWKRMDKLEAEKRILQEKLDQPVSAPPSPRDISMEIDSPENMMRHIRFLKNEVERLKKQLRAAQLQLRGSLTLVASPIVEHRLQTRRLSGRGSQAQPLRGMWDLLGPGHEPVSPASAGGLSTAAPPGKPCIDFFYTNSSTMNIPFCIFLFTHYVLQFFPCQYIQSCLTPPAPFFFESFGRTMWHVGS
ncbi:coiled-coil domain-containing protein 6 isoform X2 [Globicephala melas]|uniref:coiled-coil domain-containing protein 6 isoform X2 n=1 Tax=Globicephala melas TaxID=9731 RepID=UPI00293D74F3|nr:coiled-coil domain-containing protein 6 isoform X2 [Globicephala melas]